MHEYRNNPSHYYRKHFVLWQPEAWDLWIPDNTFLRNQQFALRIFLRNTVNNVDHANYILWYNDNT
jgi:hypothetical protein